MSQWHVLSLDLEVSAKQTQRESQDPSSSDSKKPCVPAVLREELLVAYHGNNAHADRERLYNTLKQKYYFTHMYASVIECVSSRDVCQTTKTSPHTRKSPLAPLSFVEPFGRIYIYIQTM